MRGKHINSEIVTAGIALFILVFSANVVIPAVGAVIALIVKKYAIAKTLGTAFAFAGGGASGMWAASNACKSLGWEVAATAFAIACVACAAIALGCG